MLKGHVCTFTFVKSGQHLKQYSQKDDDDNKHGADKKPATWLWGKTKKKFDYFMVLCCHPLVCRGTVVIGNYSPSTVRMKLFLISTLRDL